MSKSFTPPSTTKESLQKLVLDIQEIPDGDVDRYLIIGEIEKIINDLK